MPICKDCEVEFERHSKSGPIPTRCAACSAEAKRAISRNAYARLREVQASIPRRNAAQPPTPSANPVCECGQQIIRTGRKGAWPKRCPACAVVNGRAKSLRWFYKETDARLGEIRSQHPTLWGRQQTAEHITKRTASARETLANQRRECPICNEMYTPTSGGQQRCSKHRTIRTGPKRSCTRVQLSPAMYEAMLTKQGWGCAICKTIPNGEKLAVDHDHKTGEVRGLLCRHCNTGLGGFRDEPKLLNKAIAYLKR